MSLNYEKLTSLGIKCKNISGNQKVICPSCSSDRKKKNDPCLSVDVVEGVYNCFHCEFKGNVMNKHVVQKEYIKPPPELKTLSQPVIDWFAGRGISNQTLIRYKISEGVDYMPQSNKEVRTIHFNYIYNGEVVNIKYRDSSKNFKLVGGAMLCPFGIDVCLDNLSDSIVFVEGECFDSSAEIFTQEGWKLFSDLNPNDKVAQVSFVNGSSRIVEFVKPTSYIAKRYNGDMVKIANNRNSFYSLTTPDHNILTSVGKVRAKDIDASYKIYRSAVLDGSGVDLSNDEIALYTAISADFTIRKEGDIYGCFKKKRKADRIIGIMDRLGVKYSCNIDGRNYYSIFIKRGHGLSPFKEFPVEWSVNMSAAQREFLINEIIYWDGNTVPNRTMTEYSTVLISNAKFIQTIAHTCGYSSTIINRSNKLGRWYKVTILRKDSSVINKHHVSNVRYDDMVYCVTVPSGAIMVRQNNLITISGNCDALSYYEAGIKAVVSVPNGASKGSQKLEWLDDFIHLFENKKVYLSCDMDDAGISLRNELARRFGKENCWIVNLPCKDANEVLTTHGKDRLIECFNSATQFPVEGIDDANSVRDELIALYENGTPKGYDIGYGMLWHPGQVTLVTGIPGHGKSTFVKNVIFRLAAMHGLKSFVYSAEEANTAFALADMIQIATGKSFFHSENRATKSELDDVIPFLDKHFKYYKLSENDLTIDAILEKAKHLVKRFGVNIVVIDNMSTVEKSMSNQMDTRHHQIKNMMNDIARFARLHDVHVILVAHPKKMSEIKTGLYKVPNGYDVGDSSHWYNLPDNGITVYRNFETRQTEVHRWKVRFRYTGEVGHSCFFYNINSNTFTPDVESKSKFVGQPSKEQVERFTKLADPF